jgi:hypothetical protein
VSAAPWSAFPLVLVEWQDSHLTGTWEGLADILDECQVCRSVGYLVHDGAVSKVVAPHVATPDGVFQGTGLMTIPAGAVLRVVPLVEGEADATG